MNISPILLDDFTYISAHYDFSALKEKSIFITGATGLLGKQLVLFLSFLNETQSYNTQIFAFVRSIEKAKSVFDGIDCENLHVSFVQGDILDIPVIAQKIDYIVHGASVTSSQAFVKNPVETIDIAVNGTKNILEFARKKQVRSVAYLSSMEVFGVTSGEDEVKESDYGYIDILNTRSSYSESKRLCECLCASYAAEYAVPVKIARLTQTFGPGIDYNDTRVAAQFARAVIEGKDIVLKTEGKTKRPVLYTRDAVSAILTVLLKGANGESYTAANPATFKTIRETAELIIEKIAKNTIKLVFSIDIPKEYAPNLNLNLNLNADKLCSLGWNPSVDLETAYKNMIFSMKADKK